MAYPAFVRKYGAHYIGMWVAILDDEPIDADESKVVLAERLKLGGLAYDYLARVPNRKRP